MTSEPCLDCRYDAVVVGARVAGAATALLLARRGHKVLVVDRSPYGSDTLSTHALMRAGVLQLERWGVLEAIRAAGTPAVRQVSFHYADDLVEVPIQSRDGVEALYAPRRTVLDAALVDAARNAGATFVFGPRVVDLIRARDGRIRGAVLEDRQHRVLLVRGEVVIGADGTRSTVASLVGAEPYRLGASASGVVYGYWRHLDVAPGRYHWHYAPGVTAGVIPTNDGWCLFVSVPSDRFMAETRHDLAAGYRQILAETSPALAVAVERAEPLGGLHGFAGQVGYFRQSAGPGWALVGDAGYFKDPITAHGMTDALRDAELLADAVDGGTPAAFEAYQRTRDRLSDAVFAVTDEIAGFRWSLDHVRNLHKALSRGMADEVRHLAGLPADRLAVAAG